MTAPIKWIDSHFISPHRIVLTNEDFHIPGLITVGKHTMYNAIAPLTPHYHENCVEIVCVTKGVISFSDESTEYKVSGGNVFLTRPNEIHSTNERPLSIGEIYWFQLDISTLDNFLFLNHESALYLTEKLASLSSHVVKADYKLMQTSLKELYTLLSLPQAQYYAASKICILLHYILQCAGEMRFPLTPDIGNAVNYILDHVMEEISLDDLAWQSNLSVSQFKLKFKTQMGISPRNFVNQQKIEVSTAMISEGMSITDIAMELGFNTSSYFSTVFKRYMLCSPTDYQKKINGI